MQTLRDNYFTAYRSLKLTRDARGVLVVQFHTDGGPCTFSALHHTEVDRCISPDCSKIERTRS